MIIDGNTLPSMKDYNELKRHFVSHLRIEVINKALLKPVLSEYRLKDAHYAWQDDIARMESREPNLTDGADHFKQCANLVYWLRRMGPITEFRDFAADVEDVGDLYPDEQRRRDIYKKYGSEFLAFDFGFKICSYYELEKTEAPRSASPILAGEYIIDVCHMMKFKHVSPHALYLVYKSIFL